jgi:hypothetical protein
MTFLSISWFFWASNREIKNWAKNTLKITKIKNIAAHIGDDLTQKHGYIDANQEFTRCGNSHNNLPLFGGFEGSLTFSPLLSYTMKHTHTSQKATMARGWKMNGWMHISPPTLGVTFIGPGKRLKD